MQKILGTWLRVFLWKLALVKGQEAETQTEEFVMGQDGVCRHRRYVRASGLLREGEVESSLVKKVWGHNVKVRSDWRNRRQRKRLDAYLNKQKLRIEKAAGRGNDRQQPWEAKERKAANR